MSFIIAVVMIALFLGIIGNEKAVNRAHEKDMDEWSNRKRKWRDRNYDRKLILELKDFIDDERNYEFVVNEMTEFFDAIPGLSSCKEKGFALYPHQCIGTKKEREYTSSHNKEVALIVMLANRGKVYGTSYCGDCDILRTLRFSSTPRVIGDEAYIKRYMWYENALIKGGMSRSDAEIWYIPYRTYNEKTKRMEEKKDSGIGLGEFVFISAVSNKMKERARRLWEIDYDSLMSQKYEEDKHKLIDILNQVLELEK